MTESMFSFSLHTDKDFLCSKSKSFLFCHFRSQRRELYLSHHISKTLNKCVYSGYIKYGAKSVMLHLVVLTDSTKSRALN